MNPYAPISTKTWYLLRKSWRPVFSTKLTVAAPAGYCFACGKTGTWQFGYVISDELAKAWELTPLQRESFNCRESMFCPNCGCSYRLRRLAEALVASYSPDGAEQSIEALVAAGHFKKLRIAEINSCGKLHQFIQRLPNLAYSEFGSKNKKIRSENLEALSYDDGSFDLVLTSDTLEHVPDYNQAFREINRVLRLGGKHIFTIPAIWSRQTRTCATLTDSGKIEHVTPVSFHGNGEPDYLVFTEFGYDVVRTLEACGFAVKLFGINPLNANDPSCVLVTTKVK